VSGLRDELYESVGDDNLIENSYYIHDDDDLSAMEPVGMYDFSLDPDDLNFPEDLPGLAPVKSLVNLHVIVPVN
jgi:hypothetical protein